MGVKHKSNLLVSWEFLSGEDRELFPLHITSLCKICNWEDFHLYWKSLKFPVIVCGNKSSLQPYEAQRPTLLVFSDNKTAL